MVEEIKNLRVKIDGLAQLTKELKDYKWTIDMSKIPDGIGIVEYIESLGKLPENCKYTFQSDQVKESIKSLYLAKAWLGKCLGELNVPTPYKNDGNRKSVEDIEPTADKATGDNTYWQYVETTSMSHVEKVDWLRQEIQKLYNEAESFIHKEPNKIVNIVGFQQHLSEARFWLGFELQRIKENEMK